MTEMESVEFVSLFLASSIRQCVRYPVGDAPTVCLNFSAKGFVTCRRASPTPQNEAVPRLQGLFDDDYWCLSL